MNTNSLEISELNKILNIITYDGRGNDNLVTFLSIIAGITTYIASLITCFIKKP